MKPQQVFDRFTPETAWGSYFPTARKRWNAERVAHLYRRAAFGASRKQIAAGVDNTMRELVADLIRGGDDLKQFEDDLEKLQENVVGSNNPQQLQALWMYRLLYSPHPLRERMTLFWHDHFATSNAKIANVALMQRQNDLFRKHALGHFGDMLQEIARDPAMLIWLDSDTNRKGKPNENLAREIFELFSLGVDHYTEKDIQEAARALTGWSVVDGQSRFTPRHFDASNKTILGQTGNWGAGDVVRIALRQPDCARFLVRKLFRELISETVDPTDEMLEPLAKEFRIRNYDIGWLVSKMFSSWVFYSEAAIRQRVKSPIEFVVGTVRALDGRASPLRLAEACGRLGESLYFPPSVKGWDGGSDWLNSSTLLMRQNMAFEFSRGSGLGARTDPAKLMAEENAPNEVAGFFLDLFHQKREPQVLAKMSDYLRKEKQKLQTGMRSRRGQQMQLARTAAHLALTLPEYQLG